MLTLWEHESHIRGLPFPSFRTWILASLFNSTFSYCWDVEQDWDMPWLAAAAAGSGGAGGVGNIGTLAAALPASRHSSSPPPAPRWRRILPSLRPAAAFAVPWYVWLVASNLLLRLSWTHRLVGNLEAMNAVALAVAMLEVFRQVVQIIFHHVCPIAMNRYKSYPLIPGGTNGRLSVWRQS